MASESATLQHVTTTTPTAMAPATLEHFFRGEALRFVTGFQHEILISTSCPMHSHASLEIVYHPSGRGVTRLENGATVEFDEGGVVVYAPRVVHDQSMTRSGIDICIHIECPRPVPKTLGDCIYIPAVRDPGVAAELEALSRYTLGRPQLQQVLLNHRATALLIQLFEAAGAATQDPRPAAERYAESAREFIMTRFEEIRGMEDIAEKVGISHDYLRHLFRERYGMSLSRCLGLARVERSKDLLVRSALPLKSVARLCGFENERYFSHVFRKFEHCAPGAYRRRHSSRA